MLSVKSRYTCLVALLTCLLLASGCVRAKPPLGSEDNASASANVDATPAPTTVNRSPGAGYPAPTSTALVATLAPLQPTFTITPFPTFTPPPTLAVTQAPGLTLEPPLEILPSATLVWPTAIPMVTVTATAVITQDVTYTVVAGDTLLSISQYYGTSVDAIMNKNALPNRNTIYVGQELVIPAGYGPGDTPPPMRVSHTVVAGETLSSLSRLYRTTPTAIMAENSGTIPDMHHLSPGTVLTITVGTAPERIVHTVRAGDTISSIARRYGVSVRALVQANALSNPNRLPVGQLLVIPR